jgi:hypothetical protein
MYIIKDSHTQTADNPTNIKAHETWQLTSDK